MLFYLVSLANALDVPNVAFLMNYLKYLTKLEEERLELTTFLTLFYIPIHISQLFVPFVNTY